MNFKFKKRELFNAVEGSNLLKTVTVNPIARHTWGNKQNKLGLAYRLMYTLLNNQAVIATY